MTGRLLAACALLATMTLAPVEPDACWSTGWRCDSVNDYRADHDRPSLEQRATLQEAASAWAHQLAAAGVLSHDPGWSDGTLSGGEIVGRSTDRRSVMAAWDESSCHDVPPDGPCPEHRELLLDRGFTRVGVGSALGLDGQHWYVVRFR